MISMGSLRRAALIKCQELLLIGKICSSNMWKHKLILVICILLLFDQIVMTTKRWTNWISCNELLLNKISMGSLRKATLIKCQELLLISKICSSDMWKNKLSIISILLFLFDQIVMTTKRWTNWISCNELLLNKISMSSLRRATLI